MQSGSGGMGHGKHRQVRRRAHRGKKKETAEKVRERDLRARVRQLEDQIKARDKKAEQRAFRARVSVDACELLTAAMGRVAHESVRPHWLDTMRGILGMETDLSRRQARRWQTFERLRRISRHLLTTGLRKPKVKRKARQ